MEKCYPAKMGRAGTLSEKKKGLIKERGREHRESPGTTNSFLQPNLQGSSASGLPTPGHVPWGCPLLCRVCSSFPLSPHRCQRHPNRSPDNQKYLQDFPGGAVVKNPPANAGGTGSSPGPGRSHMQRSS